jgi:hypothetical protein
MRGEQRSLALGQRCGEFLALIDSVLSDHIVSSLHATLPPQRPPVCGRSGTCFAVTAIRRLASWSRSVTPSSPVNTPSTSSNTTGPSRYGRG